MSLLALSIIIGILGPLFLLNSVTRTIIKAARLYIEYIEEDPPMTDDVKRLYS
jgi:uncharacterized protein YneF (UPF0154 family)